MSDEHLDRLLAELGARAGAELEQVRASAEAEASALLGAADERGAARLTAALAASDADYERRRAAAAAGARHDARGALLEAQHALVTRVLERARALVAAELAARPESPALTTRLAELSTYAVNAKVERRDGLVLVANEGRLVIEDTIDAWLDSERAQCAIDICQAVEQAAC